MFEKSFIDKIKEKSIKLWEHDLRAHQAAGNLPVEKFRQGLIAQKIAWEFSRNHLMHIHGMILKMRTWNQYCIQSGDIDGYLSKNECFFNYMSHVENRIRFVEDVAVFAKAYSKDKSIDVCLPSLISNKPEEKRNEIFNEIKYLLSQILILVQLKLFGLMVMNEKSIQFNWWRLKGQLIDPGGLSAKDFKVMMAISAPLVGCTGDNSLAQAISFGKIPCYERRFDAKHAGFSNRVFVALGPDSNLYMYITREEKSHTEAGLPDLIDEAKKFGEIIREKHSFNPILKGVVNETLLRQKDEDFKAREDQIRKDYLNCSISLREMEVRIKDLLKREKISLKSMSKVL